MIRVVFKAAADFDEEEWERFKSRWKMPEALLHSTIKATLAEGFRAKYGVQPSSIGVFSPEQKSKVEAKVLRD